MAQIDSPTRRSCVIGCFDNYGWEKVSVWAKSLVSTGYKGDKFAITRAATDECRNRLTDLGFKLIFRNDEPKTIPHVDRYRWAFEFLNERHLSKDHYDFVLITDVRDVLFQLDPFIFWENRGVLKNGAVGSEGVLYGNEEWGKNNLVGAFGADAFDFLKEKEILNVGVLAGTHQFVLGISFLIYKIALQARQPVADQAALNLIMSSLGDAVALQIVGPNFPWVIHAGTTSDPAQMKALGPHQLYAPPQWKNEKVLTSDGEIFAIVHQYDRVPSWNSYAGREFFEQSGLL